MRNIGIVLSVLALTLAPSLVAAADNSGAAYTAGGQKPGNGSEAAATQPPAAFYPRPHNTSEWLRTLHPEAVFGTAVGLLLAAGIVLSVFMIGDAFRRSRPVSTRRDA
jgi:hypothetical protein